MDDDRETLERYLGDVEYGGRVEHPYSMPYQHFACASSIEASDVPDPLSGRTVLVEGHAHIRKEEAMCRRSERFLALALAVALLGVAAPLAAADGACAPLLSSRAPGPLDPPLLVVPVTAKGGSIDGPSEQSVCNAQCDDGSYVSCWGTTCNATDASCPGQQGYCWGSSTGYKLCPSCPRSCGAPCSADAVCNDGSHVSCNGCSGDCFAVDGCYAHCDSQYHLCPNPPPSCPF